jgi:hypothetical protein
MSIVISEKRYYQVIHNPGKVIHNRVPVKNAAFCKGGGLGSGHEAWPARGASGEPLWDIVKVFENLIEASW